MDSFEHEVERERTPVSVNSGGSSWKWAASKIKRDIGSVVLDPGLKDWVLEDATRFRKESTNKWYRRRGVPYRRGYLFHGPPGTGKSSLAFALAGHFGMEVFSASLTDSSLSDSDLPRLFSSVSPGSLLLLEDIDSAGLTRESPSGSNNEADSDDPQNGKRKKAKGMVTLAGLLNSIDGVIAPEGHILVMTTNKPLNLDHALTRAGRVDVHLDFQLVNAKQAEGMFRRMYSLDRRRCKPQHRLSDSG
jgi:mitochondrial chaperone BCS1